MPTRAEINREVAAAARRHGVDPNLFAGLVRQESGFNPNAISPAGAIGLAQLMPKTAAGLSVNPHDWRQNLDGGARYLQNAMRINKGNLQRVLASYNAGQGAVDKYGGIPPYAETQHYVQVVLRNAKEFKQAGFDRLAGGAPLTAAAPPKTAPLAAQASPAPSGGGLQAQDPYARQSFLQNLIDQNSRLAGISSVAVPLRAQAPAPVAAAPTPAATPAPGVAAVPGQRVIAQPGINGLVKPLPTAMTRGSEFRVSDAEGAPDGKGGRYHAGKDWFAPAGSTVAAPINGKIVEVKASRGNSGQVFGGVVKVQAANGQVFVFRHVDPAGVKVGQKVGAGTPIARVSAWTGGSPHSHIEIWKTYGGGYNFNNMIDPATVFGG